jgi:hypothetical protein
MGRPWVDHESWELVDEASDVAERDVARLLLDADADELRDTRHAQLTTDGKLFYSDGTSLYRLHLQQRSSLARRAEHFANLEKRERLKAIPQRRKYQRTPVAQNA